MSRRPRRTAFVTSVLLLIGAAALTASPAPVAAAPPPAGPPVIAAVGDIACQSFSQSDGEGVCRSDEVAALVTSLDPDAFLPLGDIQYRIGGYEEFLRVVRA